MNIKPTPDPIWTQIRETAGTYDPTAKPRNAPTAVELAARKERKQEKARLRKARREENSKRRKAANKAAKVAAKLAAVEGKGLQDGEEMAVDREGGRLGGEKKRWRKGRNGHKDEHEHEGISLLQTRLAKSYI